MTSFVILEDSVGFATLASGEFGFIAETGSLVSIGNAVTSSGQISLTVLGSLISGGSAVAHATGFLALSVGTEGGVFGGDGDGVTAVDVAGAFVSNRGRVNSNAVDGLDVRTFGEITILNAGTVTAARDAIVTESVGLTRIVNTGTIVGDQDGIDHLDDGSLLVINRGSIRGKTFAGIDGAEGEDAVRNSGSIRGGVELAAADDTVSNSGTIDRVVLGAGEDSYVGRGNGRAGIVSGNGGNDTLIGSRSDDTFVGGGDADLFVFARNGGDDTIRDFAGSDQIDLRTFGQLNAFRDIRDDIEDARNGCRIELPEFGLELRLLGVERADLSADDFLFAL